MQSQLLKNTPCSFKGALLPETPMDTFPEYDTCGFSQVITDTEKKSKGNLVNIDKYLNIKDD